LAAKLLKIILISAFFVGKLETGLAEIAGIGNYRKENVRNDIIIDLSFGSTDKQQQAAPKGQHHQPCLKVLPLQGAVSLVACHPGRCPGLGGDGLAGRLKHSRNLNNIVFLNIDFWQFLGISFRN